MNFEWVDADQLDAHTTRHRLALAGIVVGGAFFLASLFLVVVVGWIVLLLSRLGWEFFLFRG